MRAVVLPAALEGDGKFAGWTVFAKQHLGQGGATLLPGIPCLEERGHPIEPWDHIHGTARSHHDDDVLICSGELRSEEHTSELQSPDHLVCRLLLEKKKKKQH